MDTNAAVELTNRVFRAESRQDSTDRIIEAIRGETNRNIAEMRADSRAMREELRADAERRKEEADRSLAELRTELRADAERRKEETDRWIADLREETDRRIAAAERRSEEIRAAAERRSEEMDRRMADFHETVQEIRADIREIRADGRSLRLWLLGTTLATILGVAAVVAAIGQMQISWVQRELDTQNTRIAGVEEGLKQQKRDFDDFRRETAERFSKVDERLDRIESLILDLHEKNGPRAEAGAPQRRR